MRKCKWLSFLLLLPIIFVLTFTNCYIDPANIFHDYSEEIAESILRGNATHFGSSNVNEREVKHNLIIKMPDKVECIAVGPSLVMGVRSEIAGSDNFYNLGHSGANFYDILAQFGLMEAYGKKVDRVIFCVDSYFFDDTLMKRLGVKENLKKYTDYMIDILNGEETEKPRESDWNELETKVRQMFSVTYFQASVDSVQAANSYVNDRERWGIVGENFDGTYYMPDASWVYARSYQNRTEEDVRKDSEEYNIERQFSKGEHVSEYCKDIFEKLIRYLLSQRIETDLYLCPVAPSLWDRIEEEEAEYPIIEELEEYANRMAKKYNLKITGSYNPYNLDMEDKDFYDARHVRHELLGTYFDFRSGRYTPQIEYPRSFLP